MRRPAPALASVLLAASLGFAAGPPAGPTATDVGEALRTGGIAFTSPVVEGRPSTPALSGATTTTRGGAVTIRVYGSNAERYAASARSAESCPDCTFVACGPILVEFETKADPAAEKDVGPAYRILHERYGCE